MSNDACIDCDAAVTLPIHDVSEDPSAQPSSSIFDYIPFGFDEGAVKLALAYAGMNLATDHRDGIDIDATLDRIVNLKRQLETYKTRSQSLTEGFTNAAKRMYLKVTSVISENALIFGSAAVGSLAGAAGGIAVSTAATYPQVFGAAFLEELEKAGCDLTNRKQIAVFWDDESFARQSRTLSHIHALKMSSAVLGAGVVAGYIYSSVAKPAAQVSANYMRSLMPGISIVARDNLTNFFSNAVAKGMEALSKNFTKRAIQSIPARAFILPAVYVAGDELHEQIEEGHDLDEVSCHVGRDGCSDDNGIDNWRTHMRYYL